MFKIKFKVTKNRLKFIPRVVFKCLIIFKVSLIFVYWDPNKKNCLNSLGRTSSHLKLPPSDDSYFPYRTPDLK